VRHLAGLDQDQAGQHPQRSPDGQAARRRRHRGWKAALERVRESPFLLGQSERDWVVSFDWLIKPSNFVKVIEGVYRRVTPKPRAAPKSNAELLAESMGYGRPAQTASGPFDNPPTIDGEAINA
jgi:hypothetical protein